MDGRPTETDRHVRSQENCMTDRPDIVLILNDDMGFSDLGCYGGEIQTPTLDVKRQEVVS